MTEIKIRNDNGDILETVKISADPGRFILYRGRLIEKVGGNLYVERVYLEIN